MKDRKQCFRKGKNAGCLNLLLFHNCEQNKSSFLGVFETRNRLPNGAM